MRVEGRTNEYVARDMLLSDLAYVLTAFDLGLTPGPVAQSLCACLLKLLPDAAELGRQNPAGDIVLQRETWVSNRVGRGAAAWLHLGRHRAESLRGYLPRMVLRRVLVEERSAMLGLVRSLLDRAEPLNHCIAPVYHHYQHAGQTTLGEYLTSWAANFVLYLHRLREAELRLDLAPPSLTGRATLLNDKVAESLGFTKVARLRQQFQVTEDHFSEPFSALIAANVGIARLAEDLRLFGTSEYAFFELSDRHASSSSALPQKKNAFGLQAIIGGAKIGVGRLAAQLAMSFAPSDQADTVYHAGSLYQHAQDVVLWTRLMAEIIDEGSFDCAELRRKATFGFAGAAEALDMLVFEHHLAPRTAHHHLGAAIRAAHSAKTESQRVTLRPALSELPEPDRLTDVILGEVAPETALNMPALVVAQAELRTVLEREQASLQTGNKYEASLDQLVRRAEAFIRTSLGTD